MPPVTGWFDPSPKGGALRLAANSYLPAKGDPAVRVPGLRRGDLITLENGRVTTVNGLPVSQLDGRPEFASLGAVHPSRPLTLETPRASSQRTADIQRVVDLVCPFGFGQRALIVSPPKAGKTMMLQAIAEAVAENHPPALLLILLVDERPEEVTEMVDWGRGEVIASSFDLPHERHVAAAEMVFDHARRQVELARDVVIVLDSLTRLARSHNTTGRGSGRTMTRALADRRIYPAVDIAASGTRREELLADARTLEAKHKLRRALVDLPPEQGMQNLLQQMKRAKTNAELLNAL